MGAYKRQHAQDATTLAALSDPCGVSVLVYARENPTALKDCLRDLSEQEYAGPWEVIVLNDGSDSEVTDVINRATSRYPQLNIRLTYVPAEARNLSRKKLAISLGIKAAKYEVVLLTGDECRTSSPMWLATMMHNFNVSSGTEVVLGWAAFRGLNSLRWRFDQLLNGVEWTSSAVRRKPFRGTGFNLAYRRGLFFEQKGFSKWLNLHHGDDDLFVSQIANKDNTVLELSRAARLKIETARPEAAYKDERLSHFFTRRFVGTATPRFFGFSSLMIWLQFAAVEVGIVFSLPNILPALVLFLLLALTWWPVAMAWRSAAKALGLRMRGGKALWGMLWHWATTIWLRRACNGKDRHNYTWVQR